MGSIKKSFRTSWWLMEANQESKVSIIAHRALLLLVPTIVGIGVAVSLTYAVTLYVGIFIGIGIFIIVAQSMTSTDPAVSEFVERYLNDEDFIDAEKEYIKTYEDSGSYLKPSFYRGAGEWMCLGHAPIREFIDAVTSIDKTIKEIPYRYLEDLVQYNYAISVYSHRLKREALKIVPKDTPRAYRITRLKSCYDLYFTHTDIPATENYGTIGEKFQDPTPQTNGERP